MARPRVISEETRQAVAADLRERWGPEFGLRGIADAHSVSLTFVRTVAREHGITAAHARTQTENASEQLKATFPARRAALAARLLVEAERALEDIDNGSVVVGISFGAVVSGRSAHTTARDRRELLTAAAIAFDKHKMLDQYDSTDDKTEVGKFLKALRGDA